MIGIISIGQIELCPFAKKYISALEKNNIEFEIVHWNRSGVKSPNDDINITYSEHLGRYISLFSKAMPFVRFSRFAKSVIRKKKYDKLIILTTQTALMLKGTLGKYKNKYFFDYRDVSYEHFKPYKKIIDKVIKNSFATCISSDGFREYLTDEKELLLSHNFQTALYESRVIDYKKTDNEKIVVGYIGYLREFEYLKKFVSIFGNDARFEFQMYGGGDCLEVLREYAKKYDNVFVNGAYLEQDKMSIIEGFDLIFNCYEDNFVNHPAVSNKYYDGVIRKKPLFCNAKTFSGKMAEEKGIGISLFDDDEKLTDKLYDYIKNLDGKTFSKNCETFLEKIIEDEEKYIAEIEKFIKL